MDTAPLAPRTVTVRAYTRYDGSSLFVRPVLLGDAHATIGGTVEVDLLTVKGSRVVQTRTMREVGIRQPEELRFDTAGAPWGCCALRARFRDRHGVEWPADLLHDHVPAELPWLGCTDGVTREVPPPWTALRVERGRGTVRVHCSGRRYTFGGGAVLDQVTSAGRELLAAPVRFVAATKGGELDWRGGAPDVVSQADDRVILSGTLRARGVALELRVRWEIEFDGTVRVDCAFAARAETRIERLRLEVPFRDEVARYLYTFPGQWGSARNAGALGRGSRAMPFKPYVWIGDEERGLGWFSESDENWVSSGAEAERRRAVRVERRALASGEEAAVLALHLATVPITLRAGGAEGSELTGIGESPRRPAWRSAAALRYSFGLQATPVKPVARSAWDDRIVCIGQQTAGFKPRLEVTDELLDSLAAAGVRTVVIFEHWSDAEGYVRTPHGAALRRIVAACHARMIRVLLYFGFLASDIAPEWQAVGKDSLKLPKSGYPVYSYAPQPVQGAWIVCLASSWQDLLVRGIAEALREHDADGVYLDGTELPFACVNTEHGCGRQDAAGAVVPTYPIWATRTAMRRIASVVRAHRPDGLVNVHNSTCMVMPTLGWATSYWDGEQFQGVESGADVTALLPLDAFRAEFMGRQWGVAPEFLLAGGAYTFAQACSFALLHDVPVRPNPVPADLDLMARIWRAMDAFGRSEARWVPYWESAGLVSAAPAAVKASVWIHPTRGRLVMVANTGRSAVEAVIRLPGAAVARDALSGEHLEPAAGALRFPLEPLGWRLLRAGTEAEVSGGGGS